MSSIILVMQITQKRSLNLSFFQFYPHAIFFALTQSEDLNKLLMNYCIISHQQNKI